MYDSALALIASFLLLLLLLLHGIRYVFYAYVSVRRLRSVVFGRMSLSPVLLRLVLVFVSCPVSLGPMSTPMFFLLYSVVAHTFSTTFTSLVVSYSCASSYSFAQCGPYIFAPARCGCLSCLSNHDSPRFRKQVADLLWKSAEQATLSHTPCSWSLPVFWFHQRRIQLAYPGTRVSHPPISRTPLLHLFDVAEVITTGKEQSLNRMD